MSRSGRRTVSGLYGKNTSFAVWSYAPLVGVCNTRTWSSYGSVDKLFQVWQEGRVVEQAVARPGYVEAGECRTRRPEAAVDDEGGSEALDNVRHRVRIAHGRIFEQWRGRGSSRDGLELNQVSGTRQMSACRCDGS